MEDLARLLLSDVMQTFLVLIADNLKSSLRTRKALIFLVLYFLVFAIITYIFFGYQESVERQIASQGVSNIQQGFLRSFLRGVLTSGDDVSPVVQFLFSVPPLNMILFFVSLIGTPLLIFIINYDKVSQEVYDGTIRYLLFRVSRAKIFFAKFIASLLECSAITFLALFLGVWWGSARFASVDFSISMSYGIRYWLIAQFFLSVYVAFTLMASSIFKKPFTSLVFCFVSYVVMPVLSNFVSYITPYDTYYFEGLFFNTSPRLFFSLAVYLIFSGLFLSVGYFIFKRKDL